jgi:hypothetical protein
MTMTSKALAASRVAEYTEAQATDEALRMFVRRMRRLHTDAYNSVIVSLSDDVRWALTMADNRADALRATDQRDGIVRAYPALQLEDEGESEETP